MEQQQHTQPDIALALHHRISQITLLAMQISSAGIAHVFMDYSGHVQVLTVQVQPASTNYAAGATYNYLINETLWMDKDSTDTHSLRKLDSIIAELQAINAGEQLPYTTEEHAA